MLLNRTIKYVLKYTKCEKLARNASHVAFIGVGNMGARMANSLIKKGYNLKIYDSSISNAKSIKGAQISTSPQEAADGASFTITMLPNCEIVQEVVLGDEGVLKTIPKNSLLIDCSTIKPKAAQDIAKRAEENNIRFIDAPVSGGITGAEAGTLTFMVGGPKLDVDEAEPLLLKMGSKVLHCGSTGAGQVAKLCNNLILGVTMVATAEAMNLGVKLGLDPQVLTSVVNVSSGRSWCSDTYNPVPGVMPNVPASNDYKGGFLVKLMAKDLGLAENAALECGSSVPLGAVAHQLYRALISNGYGEKDFTSIYKFLKGL